eukprot:GHVO01039335.1.p1 GENE.GHVO01039335.1~~GHVO01039335.1.p1  ORF type:complete len:229 (+),score=20.99 GHVO01039335.1:664-1350(+)
MRVWTLLLLIIVPLCAKNGDSGKGKAHHQADETSSGRTSATAIFSGYNIGMMLYKYGAVVYEVVNLVLDSEIYIEGRKKPVTVRDALDDADVSWEDIWKGLSSGAKEELSKGKTAQIIKEMALKAVEDRIAEFLTLRIGPGAARFIASHLIRDLDDIFCFLLPEYWPQCFDRYFGDSSLEYRWASPKSILSHWPSLKKAADSYSLGVRVNAPDYVSYPSGEIRKTRLQ